jgi:hypothetical protein
MYTIRRAKSLSEHTRIVCRDHRTTSARIIGDARGTFSDRELFND